MTRPVYTEAPRSGRLVQIGTAEGEGDTLRITLDALPIGPITLGPPAPPPPARPVPPCDRCAALPRRLAETEATIERLRALIDEAHRVLVEGLAIHAEGVMARAAIERWSLTELADTAAKVLAKRRP